MMITFRCSSCEKRFWFSDPEEHDGLLVCFDCRDRLVEKENKAAKEAARKRRLQERKKKKQEADRLLLEKVRADRLVHEKRSKKTLKQKEPDKEHKKEPNEAKPLSRKGPGLEKKAELLSKKKGRVLYVYADVKRVKAIEWLQGKRRIALNKERELRKTHKGGFSQEKFQRYVEAKKGRSLEWIISLLSRQGVLRPPYDEVVVDSELDVGPLVDELCSEVE